jgi:DNA-binding transcriptional LysR family regulator
MLLQLHQLRSFVAVVESGSFTAGAATLGLSKAVVSIHVKHLEAELGCALLSRTTRRMVPTEAGERFHRSAASLLHQAEGAVAEVRGVHDGLTGALRLTSLPEYVTSVLVPAIAGFSARHPRLHLEISASSGVSDLVRERFDLAIRLGRLPDSSSLQSTRLGSFQVQVVATPELLVAHGVPRTTSELASLPWVAFGLSAARGEARRPLPLTDDAGVTVEFTPSAIIRTDSASAVHALVRANAGAGALPDWLIKEDLASGRLVRVLPHHELPTQGIFAVRPRARHVSTPVRRFVDYFRAFVKSTSTIGPERLSYAPAATRL